MGVVVELAVIDVVLSHLDVTGVKLVFTVKVDSHFKLEIYSGSNFDIECLPNVWWSGNFANTLSAGKMYFTSAICNTFDFPIKVNHLNLGFP